MKRLELTITALSPLALGRRKPGGSVSEVENYIPGIVLRGAIASLILQQGSQQSANFAESDNDFQALFLADNPAIFHNAYPAVAKVEKGLEVAKGDIQLVPATAVSSKTNPGFTSTGGHGVFDTLIDSFCAAVRDRPYDPSDSKAVREGTNPQVESFSGFYTIKNGNYYSHNVSSRFLTRVGINRRSATAEEDILYSIEVLNESFLKNSHTRVAQWENFVYRSFIFVPDDSLGDALQRFINDNSDNFRIGGSASRGLGKVKITATEGKLPISVKVRLDEFNKVFLDRSQLWSSVFGNPKNLLQGRTFFTLDLQSDAILNENWQHTTVISPHMLQQFTGVENADLELHVAYSSYDYRSGWNAAWGLMKDVELVTNKGSVYLFSTTQPDRWLTALEKLEEQGVGDRTSEGFGRVQVCHEFHQIFRENAK